MSKASAEQAVQKLCNEIPRSKWGEYLDSLELSYSELQEVETYASAASTVLAEISEYAGFRGAYGCGDHGHDNALEAAKKMRKRVRKAIGYTSP